MMIVSSPRMSSVSLEASLDDHHQDHTSLDPSNDQHRRHLKYAFANAENSLLSLGCFSVFNG